MFRKTAAIAVLILLVSSLFAGSVTIVPVKEQAVINTGGHPGEFERPATAAFAVVRGMVSETYASGEPDTGFMPIRVAGGFMPFGLAGAVYVTNMVEAGMSVNGEPDAGYSMVVLTNESCIEVSGPPDDRFIFNDNLANGSKGFIMTHKIVKVGAEPVNWTIHSPVLMIGPGGATIGRYDMQWESRHGLTGAAGEVGVFDGHLEMPWPGEMGMDLWPLGLFFGDGRMVQLNGTMVMDTANLTLIDDGVAEASPYNNHITAGQTSWHKVDISNAVKSFNVDVKWSNVDDSLRLVLYGPDGQVLGPYYDDSDGKIDGRINLNIANPSDVATGEWHLKVTDMATLGNNDYYVKTY